jgi:hypothetical protein
MTIVSTTFLEKVIPNIEILYKKGETYLMDICYFDLETIERLVVFLKQELPEVRDDLQSKIIVRIIRRLHKSDTLLKKLEKNTQAYNYNLNKFIDYGLQHYVDLVKINSKKRSLFSKICTLFCFRSNEFRALNEITKNLVPSISISSLGNSTGLLTSPMEVGSDSETEVAQQQSPSPSLPDNCQIVDPNKVSTVFEMDATPEKL